MRPTTGRQYSRDQNVVERAVISGDGETFAVDDAWFVKAIERANGPTIPFADEVAQREKELIEAALIESEGRISGRSGAAAGLGIPRQTLDSRIKVLGATSIASKCVELRSNYMSRRVLSISGHRFS